MKEIVIHVLSAEITNSEIHESRFFQQLQNWYPIIAVLLQYAIIGKPVLVILGSFSVKFDELRMMIGFKVKDFPKSGF